MIYLKRFSFPSMHEELSFLHPGDSLDSDRRPLLHTGSFYPFNVLPYVSLNKIEFDSITILYGENGCGKTTALNIIAEKLHLKRDSLFIPAVFSTTTWICASITRMISENMHSFLIITAEL